MHIYRGKLNWQTNALNEALTILEPAEFAPNDPICVCWQWTTDTSGCLNSNKILVGVIGATTTIYEGETAIGTKLDIVSDEYYKFQLVVSTDLKSLGVTMSRPDGESTTTTLALDYSELESMPSGIGCYLYIGKLDWFEYAVDEMLVFIASKGPNLGNPICAYWQWTKDAGGAEKVNVDMKGIIDNAVITRDGNEGTIGFFQREYYKFAGEVNNSGNMLTLTMSNPAGDKSNPMDIPLIFAHVYE